MFLKWTVPIRPPPTRQTPARSEQEKEKKKRGKGEKKLRKKLDSERREKEGKGRGRQEKKEVYTREFLASIKVLFEKCKKVRVRGWTQLMRAGFEGCGWGFGLAPKRPSLQPPFFFFFSLLFLSESPIPPFPKAATHTKQQQQKKPHPFSEPHKCQRFFPAFHSPFPQISFLGFFFFSFLVFHFLTHSSFPKLKGDSSSFPH
jgi:hypothetical protein